MAKNRATQTGKASRRSLGKANPQATIPVPPLDDRPTIGLLLCRGKKHRAVEYALRGLTQPVGIADWETQLGASETVKQPVGKKATKSKSAKRGKGDTR